MLGNHYTLILIEKIMIPETRQVQILDDKDNKN